MLLQRVKSALDIKVALQSASKKLQKIGYNASHAQYFDYVWNGSYKGSEDSDVENCKSSDLKGPKDPDNGVAKDLEVDSNSKVQTWDNDMIIIARKINKIYQRYITRHGNGSLNLPLNLRIDIPGCKFDGPIDGINALLPQSFERADVSGLGNTEVLDTQVDRDTPVRAAREIPSQHFSVEPTLLRKIEKAWRKSLMPSAVRAEPYKIQWYGPGDQFQVHPDAPEKGLVGTFLLGLGDRRTKSDGHFIIGQDTFTPGARWWAAFYPDVAYEVSKFESGYLAVIVFKIFHTDPEYQTQLEVDGHRYAETRPLLGEALAQLTVPFGLEFTPKPTAESSEFGALLMDAVRKLPDVSVYTIPVLTAVESEVSSYPVDERSFSSNVYPLTDAHLDFLLGVADIPRLDESVRWLDKPELGNIPFYSLYGGGGTVWSRDTHENTIEDIENSIYLNHAMVILPVATQ